MQTTEKNAVSKGYKGLWVNMVSFISPRDVSNLQQLEPKQGQPGPRGTYLLFFLWHDLLEEHVELYKQRRLREGTQRTALICRDYTAHCASA